MAQSGSRMTDYFWGLVVIAVALLLVYVIAKLGGIV